MRRSEKEIIEIHQIEDVLKKADVCRVGLSTDDTPYIIPMNFGYKDNCLYLHSAKEGRKIDMLRANPKVCFEVEVDTELVSGGDVACKWGMKFTSVIGYGYATIINEENEKKRALDILMNKYAKGQEFVYLDNQIAAISIIMIKIDQMSCKKTGY